MQIQKMGEQEPGCVGACIAPIQDRLRCESCVPDAELLVQFDEDDGEELLVGIAAWRMVQKNRNQASIASQPIPVWGLGSPAFRILRHFPIPEWGTLHASKRRQILDELINIEAIVSRSWTLAAKHALKL